MHVATISSNQTWFSPLPWDPCFTELQKRTEEVFQRIFREASFIGSATGSLLENAVTVFFDFIERIFPEREPSLEEASLTTIIRKIQTIGCHDSALLSSIKKIEQMVSSDKIQCQHSQDHHALHNEVTFVVDKMVTPQMKAIGRVFLKSLEGREIAYPDGYQTKLDFSVEKQRLEGKKLHFGIEKLNPSSPTLMQDIKSLVALERECSVKNEIFPEERLKNYSAMPGFFCFVARRSDSPDLLAYVWGFKERGVDYIYGLGRSASSAKLGIGDKLLDRYLQESGAPLVCLKVRESNKAAIALYEKCGFRMVGGENDYYSYPTEKALLMEWRRSSQSRAAT